MLQHHDVILSGGQRLHVASRGKVGRPLLLFAHGFPECWAAWQTQLAAFGHDHFCLAPDLRGYNLSGKPEGVAAYRVQPLMDDLLGLMRHFGYAQCVLVAHDWGGAVAWSLAAREPRSLSKLVIINSPHPVPFARALAHNAEQQAASQYMLRFREADAAEFLLQDDCARLLALFRHPITGKSALHEAEIALYKQAWNRPGAMDAMLNYYRASPLVPPTAGQAGAAGLKLDPEDFLVPMPTLVIWGEQDQALLPVLLEGLGAVVPDLHIHRVPGASHWVVHEEPEAVEAAMRSFLTAT